MSDLSPSVIELLKEFRRTSGAKDTPRVVEDVTFSVFELMKLVNTSRDPRIYPQDAVRVMDTVKAVLEKFTRFGKPQQLEEAQKEIKQLKDPKHRAREYGRYIHSFPLG